MISPDLKINFNEIPDANAEAPIGKIHSMLWNEFQNTQAFIFDLERCKFLSFMFFKIYVTITGGKLDDMKSRSWITIQHTTAPFPESQMPFAFELMSFLWDPYKDFFPLSSSYIVQINLSSFKEL